MRLSFCKAAARIRWACATRRTAVLDHAGRERAHAGVPQRHADLHCVHEELCVKDCIQGGQTNPTCVECVNTYGCNAAFVNCNGRLPFPTCSACKTPRRRRVYSRAVARRVDWRHRRPRCRSAVMCSGAWWLGWFFRQEAKRMLGAHVGHAGGSSNSLNGPRRHGHVVGSGGRGPRTVHGRKEGLLATMNSEAYQAQSAPEARWKEAQPLSAKLSVERVVAAARALVTRPRRATRNGARLLAAASVRGLRAARVRPTGYGQPAYGQPRTANRRTANSSPFYNAPIYDQQPGTTSQLRSRRAHSHWHRAGHGARRVCARDGAPSPSGLNEKPNKGGAIMDDV